MFRSKLALLLAASSIASCVGAEQPSVENAIRKAVQPRLADGAKIDTVHETPYAGLYELAVSHGDSQGGHEVLYTDKKGAYLFVGSVYDARTSRNLTRERLDDMNKIKFSDLPLDLAIKTVKGNGKRVIAVFEDPNCGYCKRLRQTTLKDLDNVTIYTFLYNILREDSFVKSTNVWCSADRSKAWDDWMVDGKEAPAAPAGCSAPNAKVIDLGRRLDINGTPAIFFADGTRFPGLVDKQALEHKLDSIKQ
jgi:thiol:disulfide interchange protein DsbC